MGLDKHYTVHCRDVVHLPPFLVFVLELNVSELANFKINLVAHEI